MGQPNYRVDKETGAVIFKKSAGRKVPQQIAELKKRTEELERKVDDLSKKYAELISILQERGMTSE